MMVMYAYLDVSKAAVRGTNAVMSLVQVGGVALVGPGSRITRALALLLRRQGVAWHLPCSG